jgi:DNA-binding GntR family transcriptional regulator
MSLAAATLAERAYDLAEAQIVTLALPPGTVFSEGELGERLGIGRTPLREALQRLAVYGLVESIPRRGVRVTDIDVAGVQALLETRRALDRLVAAAAARRAAPAQRADLAVWADEIESAAADGDVPRFLAADRAADDLLCASARNAFAARALAPLQAHCRRLWVRCRHETDLARSAALHAALLRAAASADEPDAVRAADALIDYLDVFSRAALTLA